MHISMILTPMFIGYTEIILLVVLALIFFGGKKIPELMRGVGRGVKEFKDAVNKDYTEDEESEPASAADEGEAVAAETAAEEDEAAPARRRGRPRKDSAPIQEPDAAALPKRRGRPRKNPAEPAAEQPKRRPGRPKKSNN